MHQLPRSTSPRRRAFTVIEVVMAMLLVAILTVVGYVGFSTVTERARTSAAELELRDLADAVLSARAVGGGGPLTTDLLQATLARGAQSGAATWDLVDGAQAPTTTAEMSVAFGADDAGLAGRRMALSVVTRDGHLVAVVVDVSTAAQTLGGAVTTCSASGPAADAATVLAASTDTAVCPAS